MRLYLKNSAFGILQLLFSILIVFFSIPLFIHSYGMKMYGVFSIISIFGNLTLLFNLGLNTTLLKYISENNCQTTRNTHVSVAMILLATITFIASVVFLICQNYIVGDFFKIDPEIRSEVIVSYRLFILSNVFIMLGQPFVALIQANNDYYKTSIIQWVYNLINGVGIIFLSKIHAAFSLIAIPTLVSSVVWFLILLYYSVTKYHYRFFRFSTKNSFIEIAKQQFRYSFQVYFISLLSFFNEPLLKILVARFLGAQAVGVFDIVLRIKGQLIGLVTKVFEPLSSILASKKDKSEIRNIVHYTEQIAVLAFIPLSLIIYFFSDVILKIWLKDISDIMIQSIKVSVVVFIFSMAVLPNFYYLIYHGKMKQCMIIQIIGIVVSLTSLFGFMSISKNVVLTPVVSICAGIVASFITSVYYQWKFLQSAIFDNSSVLMLLILVVLATFFFVANLKDYTILQLVIIIATVAISVVTGAKVRKSGVLNFLN